MAAPPRGARSISPWAGSLRGPAGPTSSATPCGSAAGSFVAPSGGSNTGSFRVTLRPAAAGGSMRSRSPSQTPSGACTPPMPMMSAPLLGSMNKLMPSAGSRAPAQERVGRKSVSPFGRVRADPAPSRCPRDAAKASEDSGGAKTVPTLVLPVGRHALQPVPSFTPDAGEASCEDSRSVTDSCLTAQRSQPNTTRSFPSGRDQRSVSFGKTNGDSPPEHSERLFHEAPERGPSPPSADAAAGSGSGDMSSAASEVLRQHLERRRNQLHSMQQRLAHIGTECDSGRGAVSVD